MSNPETTIALTRYSEADEMLLGCLRRVGAQVGVRARVLLLDQKKDADLDQELSDLSTAHLTFEREVIPARGIAYARNQCIERCRTAILLFLDPDIRPEPEWAVGLLTGLESGHVMIATGRVLPRWRGERPFLARSRSVLEMYSILDLGEVTKEVTKLMGGSLGLHLSRLGGLGRFDESLGRTPGRLSSGEEMELGNRVRAAGGTLLYCGTSLAYHLIPSQRCRMSWLIERVLAAGYDRGARAQLPRPTHRMELRDRILTLPLGLPYLWGYLRGRASRRAAAR